jgi:hypothetical protein
MQLKGSLLVPFFSQMNYVHILKCYFYNIHFNNILTSECKVKLPRYIPWRHMGREEV